MKQLHELTRSWLVRWTIRCGLVRRYDLIVSTAPDMKGQDLASFVPAPDTSYVRCSSAHRKSQHNHPADCSLLYMTHLCNHSVSHVTNIFASIYAPKGVHALKGICTRAANTKAPLLPQRAAASHGHKKTNFMSLYNLRKQSISNLC